MKRFLLFLMLILYMPVQAGEYENALSKYDKVLLYFYTPECGTCRAFDSIYKQLPKTNPDFGYVKINANTMYGSRLMMKYRGHYVPYIILTDSKTKKSVNVHHSCVMDDVCLIRALKSFNG